jgi:catechol 2,3-dioxygenase-like lactoylglutathione lyase family enzyme
VELDGVQIEVPDLDEAAAAYALLLGIEPLRLDGDVRRFQLARGAVELARGAPGARSIGFVGDPPAGGWPETFHGLAVRLGTRPEAALPASDVAIDHLVVQTPDAERAIRLWRDRVGLRLALDRPFPERGLRLVFFRSGGMTLELAAAYPAPAAGDGNGMDRLHGVSYRVHDLEARRERLLRAGVDVSEARPGMRPGTSVATVRSGTAGVPTLLLEVHG